MSKVTVDVELLADYMKKCGFNKEDIQKGKLDGWTNCLVDGLEELCSLETALTRELLKSGSTTGTVYKEGTLGSGEDFVEICYEAPRGYFAKPIGERARKMLDSKESFGTKKELVEHVELTLA